MCIKYIVVCRLVDNLFVSAVLLFVVALFDININRVQCSVSSLSKTGIEEVLLFIVIL